jgi:hypothetical protein
MIFTIPRGSSLFPIGSMSLFSLQFPLRPLPELFVAGRVLDQDFSPVIVQRFYCRNLGPERACSASVISTRVFLPMLACQSALVPSGEKSTDVGPTSK